MSTRELEYVVKKYKKIKLEIITKIANDMELNFEGRYNNKKPTQNEQLKVIEEVYKDYIKNLLREKEIEKFAAELENPQEPVEKTQEKSIDEASEEMWNRIINDTILSVNEELYKDATTNTAKINYNRICNEILKLFPDKSEDDIIKEITAAIEYYRNPPELFDLTAEITIDQNQ